MELKMSFKHMKPSNAIKTFASEKSEKLAKYFSGQIFVDWNFVVEKQAHVAHCHLIGNNMEFFGEASTDSLHASIDLAIDRLEKQLRKTKEVLRDHLHKNARRTRATATRVSTKAAPAARDREATPE